METGQTKLSAIIFAVILTTVFVPIPVGAQTSPRAAARCIEGLPCADRQARVEFPKTVISLGQDTELEYESLTISDGTIIQTNGYSLSFSVEVLKIQGMLSIRAFDPDARESPPPPAPQGTAGMSQNPGPGTEGGCKTCSGAAGAPGEPGQNGANGRPGKDAGTIKINASRTAEGRLVIRNDGAPGGIGGRGGDGGPGGAGQQGGRARTGVFDCSSGPGSGGQGGSGGSGGSGGDGGRGGDGGIVVISVPKGTQMAIDAEAKGGIGGNGGDAARGGPGGPPGFGGRGDGLCQGKEADRMGPQGQFGANGKPGRPGEAGRKGAVVVN